MRVYLVTVRVGRRVYLIIQNSSGCFYGGLSSQLSPVKSTTSSNAFQIDGTNLIFNDYDTSLSLSVANRATMSTAGSSITVDPGFGALHLGNLQNAANGSGTYQSPTISFELKKIPTGSGTGTFTIDLLDGSDATRSSGERHATYNLMSTGRVTALQGVSVSLFRQSRRITLHVLDRGLMLRLIILRVTLYQ